MPACELSLGTIIEYRVQQMNEHGGEGPRYAPDLTVVASPILSRPHVDAQKPP